MLQAGSQEASLRPAAGLHLGTAIHLATFKLLGTFMHLGTFMPLHRVQKVCHTKSPQAKGLQRKSGAPGGSVRCSVATSVLWQFTLFYVVTFSAINSIYSKEILFEKEAFLAQESSKTAHFVANFLNNVLKAFFLGKFLGKSCKFCHPGTALHLCTFPVSHLDTLLHLGCFAF